MAVLAILAAGALAAAWLLPAGAGAATAGRLPDLDQEAPTGFALARPTTKGPDPWVLGFRSAVRNVGQGPLIIHGHRRSRAIPTMTADQVIRGAGRIRAVGGMRYVVSPTHRHWHLMQFDRYTLRRARGGPVVRRDVKSGFCLGDRYATPGPLLAAPPAEAVYRSRCALGKPGRLRVTEGMSVGFGDDYPANLEGQYISLAGLPGGRYRLVHRTNADRRLREVRYDNDAASVLLDLRWRAGAPRVTILARCEDSAQCAVPAAQPARTATVSPGARLLAGRAAFRLHCVLHAAPTPAA